MKEPSQTTAATTIQSARIADFSDHDQLLITKTEQAIREGLELERWYRSEEPRLNFFPLQLESAFRLPNRAEGFFGNLSIGGKPRTVMGCRQDVHFGSFPGPATAARLEQFVLREFLPRAHWNYPDGSLGGFTFDRNLSKDPNGVYTNSSTGESGELIDWTLLGKQHAWVMLTVHIHDFVVKMGPWKKRLREAAYVVPHPDFLHILRHPSKDCALQVSIGYPFVDVAPHPNFFGFGPGKFGCAIKLFSFRLSPANDLRVGMVFAAAPRAQKVFDFGKHVPDPVYGGAELLRYLSLGLLKPQKVHDRMDTQMLTVHCQVHQTLMDGVEKIWSDWLKSGP